MTDISTDHECNFLMHATLLLNAEPTQKIKFRSLIHHQYATQTGEGGHNFNKPGNVSICYMQQTTVK